MRLFSPSRGTRVLLPYLILASGLCFTLLIYHYFSKLTYDQEHLRFQRLVHEIEEEVRLRIETSTALLRAGTGLFAASDVVDAGEFQRFVRQIELEKNYPGIQGIGFSQRFRRDEMDAVVAKMERAGKPGFSVWPEGPRRDEYTAIIYLQPASDSNKLAIGFDMFTESVRRQAMETARDTGKPTASGRVKLVQEHGFGSQQQAGFLIYAPLYRKNVPLSNPSEREAALLGYVYSPFRVDDFLEPVVKQKTSEVAFQIYDGTDTKADYLLSSATAEIPKEPLFSVTQPLEVAGRTWTLAYQTKPSFVSGSSLGLSKYTVMIGVFLSLLLFVLTRAEIRARTRAERATEDVKQSEATIRKTLIQRERAEEELRKTTDALREADQRALSEYERLLERIKALALALATARELTAVYRGLCVFTNASVPCNGFFVSLYDSLKDVRTACYGWADGHELDVSALPPMPVTLSGPNSRAVRTGEVIITDDYMRSQLGKGVIVGPDNGLRPESSMAVPMTVMGRIIGTIEVQSYKSKVYRPEHVTAMSMAANLTAVAIENVRLLKLERTAREAAEESNRLKDEFLATVSHELRTPLTAILGWSRMLEGGTLDDSFTQQAVETIGRNAKAQAQIVDDILDVSRVITGNLYIDLHPLEVVPVVENAINVVRPTADAKSIHVETYFDSKPAMISADANRLQQVVWNLLSNAVKFTDSGGRVCVKVSHVGPTVEISVSDTGQGITKEFLPFVFDRFRQADSTTTRHHGGLGLGLAIARHLVEIHGGTIKAESRGPGRGSTFTIKLPLIETSVGIAGFPDTSQFRPTPPNQLLSGLNVLVVDDDSDTLKLMATALTKRHANVTAVSSAGEAIRAITQNRPDVLVSDIAMPDEDGYGLIEKVRLMENGESQNIPAVAITAYAKDEDRERALSSGFQIYLAKPVELTELISVVARAARREF